MGSETDPFFLALYAFNLGNLPSSCCRRWRLTLMEKQNGQSTRLPRWILRWHVDESAHGVGLRLRTESH